MLTNLSLFSGAGGLDLGARMVGGFRTVAYVECDPYAQGVLMSRMRDGGLDDAPIFEDVTTFDGRSLAGNVDVVSGGFPCQDVSQAGKRAGLKEGTRSGLWSHFARIICETQPRFVLVENVRGLLSVDDGGGTEPFSQTWPDSAMMLSGVCYLPPTLEPRTDEKESGSSGWAWPAPNCADAFTDKLRSSQQKDGSAHSVNLSQAITLWATPDKQDGTRGAAKNYSGKRPSGNYQQRSLMDDVKIAAESARPTPRSQDGKGAASRTPTTARRWESGEANLPEAVQENKGDWPTPSARDSKGQDAPTRHGGVSLSHLTEYGPPDRDNRKKTGSRLGVLNPDWVETLMGWPIGQTVLDAAAMAWFLNSRSRRGKSSKSGAK